MADLIDDCADIPSSLRPAARVALAERGDPVALPLVSDSCLAQVLELDHYV